MATRVPGGAITSIARGGSVNEASREAAIDGKPARVSERERTNQPPLPHFGARCGYNPAVESKASFDSACDVSHFGASEATIFSKRGSPRSGSQNGSSFKAAVAQQERPDGSTQSSFQLLQG